MNVPLLFLFALIAYSGMGFAQDTPSVEPSEQKPSEPEIADPVVKEMSEEVKDVTSASVQTEADARTMTLTIPGPRGIIMDRYGAVFANNRVVYHLAIQYPEFDKPTGEQIIAWSRKRIEQAEKLADREWKLSDEKILAHYEHRRWLPLQFPVIFESSSVKRVSKTLQSGLIFHPFYMRNYPKKKAASHIIGYVRSEGKLPDGPINYGDPLWETTYGAEGLEKLYNDDLMGKAGKRKIIIGDDGARLMDEYLEKPEVGNSLVLTLNANWQKTAEYVLSRYCRKGALVLLDAITGEVLTLASYPHYDLNVWIPRISTEAYAKLRDDPSSPMFARAFQARYPPASTFKAIVAASALTDKVVYPNTTINCPAFVKIGGKKFHNHSKNPDGYINVRKALARSNNCWFYQVGLKAGAESFLSAARQLGFGNKSGLPLFNETSGLVPTNEYMMTNHGRPIVDGDCANLSIGQGSLAASPLQVAQGMAGLANGKVLPRLRLIKQIQKYNGSVLEAQPYEVRNQLSFSDTAVKQVATGMYQVIHAGYGTGKKGSVGFTTMVGKTGTAQWVQGKELAWFAGFFPYKNPRFAYAVLYEGSKGQSVSGGQKAAPIIRAFLNGISGSLKSYLKTTPVTEIKEVTEEDASAKAIQSALKAGESEEGKE